MHAQSWLTLWLTLPTRTPTVVVAASLGHRRTRAAHATDPFGESQAALLPPSTPSCSCSRSILLGWSFRSPIWRGGGRAHGPVIRDWSQKLPKKGGCVWLPVAHAWFRSSVSIQCLVARSPPCPALPVRRLGLAIALAAKYRDRRLVVVDNLDVPVRVGCAPPTPGQHSRTPSPLTHCHSAMARHSSAARVR